MKTILNWQEGMSFEAECGANKIVTDAKSPLGKEQGMTPKELVAVGLGGCTAMDVVALLKKHKQTYESLQVEVDVTQTTGVHPAVFQEAKITFYVKGAVDPQVLLEAVKLSQTKYCGVSAMLAQSFPISYIVYNNGEEIGSGSANFHQ
ncbi:MAG: OsmC family protein [Bdellovibrio sp.]